ncbi:MAG: pyridoxal-dependent decarboxylase [Chloroflexota bacterium]
MNDALHRDLSEIDEVLNAAADLAQRYLAGINERPAGLLPTTHPLLDLPEHAAGGRAAIETFAARYYDELTASAGPRSFGYVVGGATPAAVAGDWLTAAFDQDNGEGMTAQLETEAMHMLRQLFRLPDDHTGVFVSGATMANVVGLATAREWLGQQRGVHIAQDGVAALEPVRILSSRPHSSIYKAAAMLGLGRSAIVEVPCLLETESIDPDALEQFFQEHAGQPCIVVGNAGTVNATSFDDFEALVRLRKKHHFWLHVDGAFGLFAACSPQYDALVEGVGAADSIAVDAHKWLNVPYDCGVVFTRYPDLQREVFVNANAPYLRDSSDVIDYMNRTPEASRRLRALPVWTTLMAYGRAGYQEIVERDCAAAQSLAARIEASDVFRLLTPCTFNVVCFTLCDDPERVNAVLDKLTADGTAFLTPTTYRGVLGIRAAFCNWRTTETDVAQTWEALIRCAA